MIERGRGGLAGVLLWVALGSASALGGGEMDWVPSGSHASAVTSPAFAGLELYVVSADDRPVSRGVLRKDGATLEGPAAFKAALAVAGTKDPRTVARLAALLVDRTTREFKEPWYPAYPGASPAVACAALVEPPKLEGNKVIYWRNADNVADLIRVEVTFDGAISSETGKSLLEAAQPPEDAVVKLQRGLASGALDQQAAAISAFARSGDPRVVAQLVPLLSHSSWQIRKSAVEGLSLSSDPAVGPALLGVLLNDPAEDVRTEAMRWLRDHPDPAWAAQLADKQSDPNVYEVYRASKRASPRLRSPGCQ